VRAAADRDDFYKADCDVFMVCSLLLCARYCHHEMPAQRAIHLICAAENIVDDPVFLFLAAGEK
jgi:hypothetical protein